MALYPYTHVLLALVSTAVGSLAQTVVVQFTPLLTTYVATSEAEHHLSQTLEPAAEGKCHVPVCPLVRSLRSYIGAKADLCGLLQCSRSLPPLGS